MTKRKKLLHAVSEAADQDPDTAIVDMYSDGSKYRLDFAESVARNHIFHLTAKNTLEEWIDALEWSHGAKTTQEFVALAGENPIIAQAVLEVYNETIRGYHERIFIVLKLLGQKPQQEETDDCAQAAIESIMHIVADIEEEARSTEATLETKHRSLSSIVDIAFAIYNIFTVDFPFAAALQSDSRKKKRISPLCSIEASMYAIISILSSREKKMLQERHCDEVRIHFGTREQLECPGEPLGLKLRRLHSFICMEAERDNSDASAIKGSIYFIELLERRPFIENDHSSCPDSIDHVTFRTSSFENHLPGPNPFLPST